jgi:DNA-directed RNA polymerase alpha subunit
MATKLVLIVDTEKYVESENYIRRIFGNTESLLRDIPNAVLHFSFEQVEVEPSIYSLEEKTADTEVDSILNSHIRNLGLRTIVTNALLDEFNRNKHINIETIGDLVKYSAADLLTLRGISKRGIAEIRFALDRHVLCLKGEESPDLEVE